LVGGASRIFVGFGRSSKPFDVGLVALHPPGVGRGERQREADARSAAKKDSK
jgi:hypothetical protein